MTKESKMRNLIVAATACVAGMALAAPASQAAFTLERFDTAVKTDGEFTRQAGAHPDFTVKMRWSVDEQVRDVKVDLPPGMIGNPNATDKCTITELIGRVDNSPLCPPTSQVGESVIYNTPGSPGEVQKVYNLEPPPDLPALFGFNYQGVLVRIEPRLRGTDYAISTTVRDIAQTFKLAGNDLTLWGVPADSSHKRMGEMFDLGTGNFVPIPDPAPRRPFMTTPTSCPSQPTPFPASIDSWQSTGVFSALSPDVDEDGVPYLWDGCERLPFDPSVSVDPGSHRADSPTGLTFDLSVPQNSDPGALATAHVRKVVTRFPEGMTVSPSSATGLGACSPAQIKLGTNDEPTCPGSSRIGTVSVDTPVLEDPLEGDVILATQGDNPFDSLLALYIVVKGPGVLVKIPGKVDPDPVTGQLTATFDNTPQLPFSNLRVRLRGGPTAPLATPKACGTYSTHTEVTSWASDTPVRIDSPMVIDEGCDTGAFTPSFAAGTDIPFAGAFSPFVVRITRPDGQQILDGLSIEMPEGLLAKLRGVPLCPDAQAVAGTCGAESRVATATVGAGPGSAPFTLANQPVYLAGPYKGAPYSTSVVIRVLAGPFDLGTIVVRQALHVDPDDAHVTIVSDPLPTIIQGIELRDRTTEVSVDRPEFTVNPTSCAEKRIAATFHSQEGATTSSTVRFRAGGCAALAFTPKLGLRLIGKKQMRSGGHPALRALLTQRKGQANIAKAKVTLPRDVVLDSKNAYDPKLVCDYDGSLKADCPASSRIGKATLTTPILNRPLSGAVHLVQGIRFSPTGNRIRTLPTLLVKLRGEVAINLRSKTAVDNSNRLVSTFPNVPDAPATRFALRIDGGRNGILTVTENRRGRIDLCNQRQTALVKTDGQNGRTADYPTRVKTPCAKKRKR